MVFGKLNSTKRNTLIFKGLKSKEKAYIGPQIAEFDLTNNCDNSCLACWVHSPLLDEEEKEPGKVLNSEAIKRTLKGLSELKTEMVMFSGSGEPFLHPHIFEILEYSKKLNLKCKIVTNFTVLNKKKLDRLVELGIEELTVSIWAGSPETYVKLHPNKSLKTFHEIKEDLKYLSAIKKSSNTPRVKIYNVISLYNYQELEEMLDFALEVGAEDLEFQTVDIIEGVTDFLSLGKEEKKVIEKEFFKLRKRIDCPHQTEINPSGYHSEKLEKEFREFGRFLEKIPRKKIRFQEKNNSNWASESVLKDRFGKEDFYFYTWAEYKNGERHICRTLTCPNGIPTEPRVDNPEIVEDKNLLIFKFPWSKCKKCDYKTKCLSENKPKRVKIKYLSLLGFGSFYRRVMSEKAEKGKYDKEIVQATPCYAGWIYTRILYSGEVVPCCKAHLVPVGNIYENNFSEIWNSDNYSDFRRKSRNIQAWPEYFGKIQCDKGCDNLGMNLQVHDDLIRLYGEDFLK